MFLYKLINIAINPVIAAIVIATGPVKAVNTVPKIVEAPPAVAIAAEAALNIEDNDPTIVITFPTIKINGPTDAAINPIVTIICCCSLLNPKNLSKRGFITDITFSNIGISIWPNCIANCCTCSFITLILLVGLSIVLSRSPCAFLVPSKITPYLA